MKKIHLHGPAADNLDRFHDAGSDLVVGTAKEAGTIDLARAKALVASGGAIVASESKEPPSK